MNDTKLKSMIETYRKSFQNPADTDGLAERNERIAYYQSFDKNKILSMSYDEFTAFISKLWASLMYGNKKYLVDKIIKYNTSLDNIKKLLADFIFGKNDLISRWDNFYKNAGMFGPSYMSEILSYYYPNDCVITNSQVIKALEVFGVPNMPHHNSQWSGAKYVEVCNIVKQIGNELKNSGVVVENLLSVDYFLWEVAKDSDLAEPVKETKVGKEKDDKVIKQKSIHSEIIEKLVDIGNCLGFEAESEVKVATGAVVDAVWKVKIGNMGMIMYVFEVQSHGSIDSLILNLQKANNNKAVQRLVAVSDAKQLLKIKGEADSINGLDIVLWDFEDVEMVHESLNNAFSSINKLGLVPPDFIK